MQRSEKITIGVMVIILVLLLGFFIFVLPSINAGVQNPQPMHLPYEKYFNPDNVTRVDITIDDTLFQKMIDFVPDKYVPCTIALNGDVYPNVGIKIKGASSIDYVKNSSTSQRYGFKIKSSVFQKRVIDGLDGFSLNPELLDATMMREFLTYEMMNQTGVKTPLYSYAAVYVNGKYRGLYLMVENIEQSFLKRNYGVIAGNLYHPAGTGYIFDENNNPLGPDLSTNHRGGHLEYSGENAAVYDEIFAHPVYLGNPGEGQESIMKVIRHLHDKSDMEKYLYVDEVAAYLCDCVASANLDSYLNQGKTQNYFLYEKDGKLTIFPWDLDNAFAPYFLTSLDAVNQPINEPSGKLFVLAEGIERLPLVQMFVTNPKMKEIYYTKLRDIAENHMGEHLLKRIDEVSEMIYPYHVADPYSSYPADVYYDDAVLTLKKYVTLRTQNILDQLDGKVPATYAEQNAHPELLTDIGDLDTHKLGSLDLWKKLWP